MPIRAVAIMFVVAVVLAVFYRDQICKWLKENLGKTQQENKDTDKKSEEEKENKD